MDDLLRDFWNNKTILITGTSSGLGRAIVEALAPYRVHFGMLSRREEKMRELAESLSSSPSEFWYRRCDVRNREEVFRNVEAFHEVAGKIDVAWVNSGRGGKNFHNHWDWDTVEAIIDTNLKGAIYTTRAVLEYMVPAGQGTVVGIASVASARGLSGHGIYSLTKIGVSYFWESLAAELPMIDFTIIHPGYVDTPINRDNPRRYWVLSPEEAAQKMIRAVARKKRVYYFPFQMRLIYYLLHFMPTPLYVGLARQYGRYYRAQKHAKLKEREKQSN